MSDGLFKSGQVKLVLFLLGCIVVLVACGLGFYALSSHGISGGIYRQVYTDLNGEHAVTLATTPDLLSVEQPNGPTAKYRTMFFNRDTGTFLWNTAANTTVDDGQRIYVWANGAGSTFLLGALRLSDGQQVWQYAAPQMGPGEIQVANGILYFTDNWTSQTAALNASTGTLLWQHTETATGNSTLLGMQVAGSVVYIWGDGRIAALRAQDGVVLWDVPYNFFSPTFTLTVQGSTLYTSDDDSATVVAFAASTGKQLWLFAQDQYGKMDVIGATDQVVYLNDQGVLYALRASDGTTLWSQTLHDQDNAAAGVLRHFTLTPTTLYETLGSSLSAFSLTDGTLRWGYTEPATNQPNVNVLGEIAGTVYVQTAQGVLAARVSDGQQLWQATSASLSPGMLLGTLIYIAQAVYSGDQPHSGSLPAAGCRLTISLSELDVQTHALNWKQTYRHPCA